MNRVPFLPDRPAPAYSLVVPVFNEREVLPELASRLATLLDRLDGTAEVILVDDGSHDGSGPWMRELAAADPRFRVIEFSRNFGHQIAITAGMDAAAGEAVIVMDADLQDPPELVQQMIDTWKQGFEIVYARRIKREGETWFKRATATLFYRILEKATSVEIPRDVGDFRLVGRKALETFKAMPERDRFVRGMFGWMGFKKAYVPFERPARLVGETKYPFWKMFHLAVNGIISFSDKPLRAALWTGLALSGLAVCVGFGALIAWLLESDIVAGWTSTVVIVSFFSGINLFMTGIVGLYVGGIHAESKRRPLYVVERLTGFDQAVRAHAAKFYDEPRQDPPAHRSASHG